MFNQEERNRGVASVQWVRVDNGEILVASSRGAWTQVPETGALGLDGAMPPAVLGAPQTMRHLLDGAMAAAERAAPRLEQPAP